MKLNPGDEVLEKIIIEHPILTFIYARDTLKKRFLLGEEAIAKNPMGSYLYARDILKGRFILGEEVIFNSFYCDAYVNELSKEKQNV